MTRVALSTPVKHRSWGRVRGKPMAERSLVISCLPLLLAACAAAPPSPPPALSVIGQVDVRATVLADAILGLALRCGVGTTQVSTEWRRDPGGHLHFSVQGTAVPILDGLYEVWEDGAHTYIRTPGFAGIFVNAQYQTDSAEGARAYFSAAVATFLGKGCAVSVTSLPTDLR